MLPTVGFACHEDGVVRGITNDPAARVIGHVRKRIVELVAAMPDFFCVGCCDVADPNGPRLWAVGLDEIAVRSIAGNGRLTNVSDALAVKGPLRIRIAVHAWREKLHRFLLRVVDGDEAVIPTSGG